MCYASAMTLGAPIGGEILSRFGPATLWSGAFVMASAAVMLYLSIHTSITARINSARDASL